MRRQAQRGVGVAGLGRVEQQLRAFLRQQRRAIADHEPLAELGHGFDVAALRGARKRVDGVVVAAGAIVLCHEGEDGGHGQGSINVRPSSVSQRSGSRQAAPVRRASGSGSGPPRAGEMAVRMAARIRVGLGGQPGTATSTGITFATRPALA